MTWLLKSNVFTGLGLVLAYFQSAKSAIFSLYFKLFRHIPQLV